MLEKDDGMLAIVDMAISLAEFLINLINSLLSGDFSALKEFDFDINKFSDLFDSMLG